MKKLFALSSSLLVATIALPALAQTYAVLNPFSGFGPRGDGTLVPGDRSYITTGSFQRGLSYNPATGNLIFIDRQAGGGGSSNITGSIYILNGLSGEIETTAGINGTLSTNGMSGGNFADMAVGVADDGVIYVGNLVNDGTLAPFKLYRWDSEVSTSDPIVVFSGDPGNGRSQRWGDTMDIRGSGTDTQIILGTRTISGIPGTNVAILTTADGINFAATTLSTDVGDSASGGGIAFGTGNTFWAKNVDVPLRQFNFNLTTSNATTLRSYGPDVLAASRTLEPLAVDTTADILAIVDMTSGLDRVRLYDISNPANPPALLDIKDFPVNNANGTTTKGYLDFALGRLYVHNMNNGIMAFSVDSAFLTSPTIATHPASQRVVAGRTVTLEVVAYPNATYQWQRNGTDIPGATGSVLIITNVQQSHAGIYRVMVGNSAGSTTSDEAVLRVINPADLYHLEPLWSAAPGDPAFPYVTTAGSGTPAERSFGYNALSNHLYVVQRPTGGGNNYVIHVVDASTGTKLYNLRTNGIVLVVLSEVTGANGIGLVAIDVADDGAIYACNASPNAGGGTTTFNTNKYFRVYRWADGGSNTTPVQIFEGEPTGQASNLRWGDNLDARGSGLATQILLDNQNPTARYMAILQPSNGMVTAFSSAWLFQDTTTPFGTSIGRSLDFGTGDTLWQKRRNAPLIHSGFDLSSIPGFSPVLAMHANFPATLGAVGLDLSRNLLAGLDFVGSASAPDRLALYDITDPNDPLPLVTPGYAFPKTPRAANANSIGRVLFADNRVFALNGNNGMMAFTIASGPVTPPTITAHPQDARIVVGGSATLGVSADTAEAYQWQFNETNNIADATNATYTIANAQMSDAGNYRVIVSNQSGSTISSNAVVTVLLLENFHRLSRLWDLAPSSAMLTNSRPYLPSDDDGQGRTPLYRGIAYNPLSNQVYIISRTDQTSLAGLTVNVLDASTGDDLYRLNTSSIVEGNSTIILLGMGVAEDGALYAANMANLPADTNLVYNLYRWADANSNTPPVLVYSGNADSGLPSTRWGDTMDVRGAGLNTEIIVDSLSGAFAAIFKPANAEMDSFAPSIFTQNYGSGSIGRSLQFGPTNTFWQKRTPGRLLQSRYDLDLAASASVASYTRFPDSLGPVAVDLSRNLLAGINFSAALNAAATVPDTVDLYDVSDFNNPVIIAKYDFPVNKRPNGNAIGQVVFAGNRVFAVNGNNGVAAFDIIAPGGSSPTLTITRSGSQVTISWPSSAAGFVLQKTTSLSSPDWQPVDTGGQNMATEDATTGTAYYRLRHP